MKRNMLKTDSPVDFFYRFGARFIAHLRAEIEHIKNTFRSCAGDRDGRNDHAQPAHRFYQVANVTDKRHDGSHADNTFHVLAAAVENDDGHSQVGNQEKHWDVKSLHARCLIG